MAEIASASRFPRDARFGAMLILTTASIRYTSLTWDKMPSLIEAIYPWLISAIGGFLGAALVLPTKLGEALFKFRFDKALEQFKGEQHHKLEALREQLNYLSDRGKRSNEREFAAMTALWEKFVATHQETDEAIVQFISHPDLSRMSPTEVEQFLSTTDFSDFQKEQTRTASDKNKSYADIVAFRSIAKARISLIELKQLIRTQGIFVTKDLREAIVSEVSVLYDALGEAYVRHQFKDSGIGREKSIAFLRNKDKALDELMMRFSERLQRKEQ